MAFGRGCSLVAKGEPEGMLRLLADENFSGDTLRGLFRRQPDLDIVRVQDVGLSGADDPEVECSAQEEWSGLTVYLPL